MNQNCLTLSEQDQMQPEFPSRCRPVSARCPVCGSHVAVPFFGGGMHPLATLGWPRSIYDAHNMEQLPLDFVQCPACTHVYNRSFQYGSVPYQKNPNLMFNKGTIWEAHLAETRQMLSRMLPGQPHVIEIGCGGGHFVRRLSEDYTGGRGIGLDPNTSAESGQGVKFYARLF